MSIFQLGDLVPQIDPSVYVAESANVIGQVTLKAGSSVWFGVTIRADNDLITIGENTNLQDGAILHCDPGYPLTLGDNVTVGHQVMLHGCTVGDGSLIGMQSVILNGARIGRNCLVAAGAVVTANKEYKDNMLIVGSPGRAIRTLTEEEIADMHRTSERYIAHAQRFKTGLKRLD